ncbi:YVTN family beta-propeller repeat-containing protein, partial [Bacillus cereus group sp. N6]|uniref:YncE family protein n=1 Tax=Bacillus cereus group sp. N6 TaxID=2794583 RepID=UPI001A18E5E4|nr:YVTN family beta-propeller repeat-containing protein [Bacillus cereus group sp. N6]
IYIANQNSDTVSVIDGTNNGVIATISVGGIPFGLGIDLELNYIYVANNVYHNVSVIDGNNNGVIATITVGSNPCGIAVKEPPII